MLCRPSVSLFVLWVFCAGLNAGQSADPRQPEDASNLFRVTQWTTDDGLSQTRISCLTQTDDGSLWIGTWYGLARFNGLTFTVFSKYNTAELVDETINALAEDTNHTLWIGTGNGLLAYRDHRFVRLGKSEGLPDPHVWRLAAPSSGGLWVQAGPYVSRFDGTNFSPSWRTWDSGPIRELFADNNGWLNVITKSAWLSLSPDATQLRTNRLAPDTTKGWSTASLAKSNAAIWACGSNGLEFFAGDAVESFGAELLRDDFIERVLEDHESNVWLARSKGDLLLWDRKSWKRVDLGVKLRPSSITALLEDKEGSLWVGTSGGLFQLRRRLVKTFTTLDGLPNDNVHSVCEGEEGVIWVGTDKGICTIQQDQVRPVAFNEGDLTKHDRCVVANDKGSVWIGKENLGLLQYDHGVEAKLIRESAFPGSIGALFLDRSGTLWVGSSRAVNTVINGAVKPCLAAVTNDVRVILQDKSGSFWLGTSSRGLLKLQGEKLIPFTSWEGLATNLSIWAIYEDGDRSLWLGTENGLTRYRNGKFFTFNKKQGLPNGTVNCILEDDSGCLWLSCLDGLYRIKRTRLDDVAEGRASEAESAILDAADGMESSETNGERQPAGCKSRDGRLWFPTIQGVVVVDPKRIKLSDLPPPIRLEQVLADRELVYGDQVGTGANAPIIGRQVRPVAAHVTGGKYCLPAGRAQLVEFYFAANTFVDPKRTRYRYKLSKADSDWRAATTERVAHYNNLPPGDYRFEVTAADHHGIWNPSHATFEFSVAPHLWQTWPFYIACASGLVGAIMMTQAYRLRWQRRLLKLEEQRALATERARIARDLHDDLGTALTGLALELDVVGRESTEPVPMQRRITQTAKRTRELAERMREVVWTVNPNCDNVSSLASYLEQQVSQFKHLEGTRIHLDFPEDIPDQPLGAEARHQLALSVREALTNVVRHAQATEVNLRLEVADHELVVQVKDNGRGFLHAENEGHGLSNMRTRIELIGGQFECASKPGEGTRITFRLPLIESGRRDHTSLTN